MLHEQVVGVVAESCHEVRQLPFGRCVDAQFEDSLGSSVVIGTVFVRGDRRYGQQQQCRQ